MNKPKEKAKNSIGENIMIKNEGNKIAIICLSMLLLIIIGLAIFEAWLIGVFCMALGLL
jgi:1,4-dihydroxy-2-naphthoate octaprenyltransferase